MGLNTNVCIWVRRPVEIEKFCNRLIEELNSENVALADDEIFYHDQKDETERDPKPIENHSLLQCLNELFSWPALGGFQISHPKVSMPIFIGVHSVTDSGNPDYLELQMRYGMHCGEKDEQALFRFARRLFERMECFVFLYGETPGEHTFNAKEYAEPISALSRIHSLQKKKERGEKGFFEKIILTRSLNQ